MARYGDSLDRLYLAVVAARARRSGDLADGAVVARGPQQDGQEAGREAIEVVIDAMNGHTDAVVRESADLLYNLVVLWVAAGVQPKDVWAEMDRRERLIGIAEKLPKHTADACAATQGRRARPQPRSQAALNRTDDRGRCGGRMSASDRRRRLSDVPRLSALPLPHSFLH